jgi:hypothetical protein
MDLSTPKRYIHEDACLLLAQIDVSADEFALADAVAVGDLYCSV